MAAILNVVLPVFAIMLAGYLAGRFGLLGEASSEALNRFVYYGALPALFFVSLSRINSGSGFYWSFVAAFGGGILATFVVAVAVGVIAFRGRLGVLGLQGLTAIFSNTGYMGIPLLATAFGKEAQLPAIIATMIMGAVVMPIGVVIVELDLGRGAGALTVARHVAAAVARNPLVLSAAGGLAVALAGVPLPQPIATFCDIMGAAAGPCALFAIGLFLVGRSLRAGLAEVGWLVFLKLVVQPAITWGLAFEVFAMPREWAASAVVLAALPTGALIFVLAQQYELYVERATAAILISTVISVVTLSVLFVLLGVR